MEMLTARLKYEMEDILIAVNKVLKRELLRVRTQCNLIDSQYIENIH